MEIKRKKITEKEIFEAERRLAEEVSELCGQHAICMAFAGRRLLYDKK